MNIAEYTRVRMDDKRAAQEREQVLTDMKRAYVTGIGWCWMSDGEIIEIIDVCV